MAFEDYVRRRWPLVVFALDPVTDQQNIADSRLVGREVQFAAAFAANSGRMGVEQLASAMRQVARASSTVGLNRTVTAFVHGNESFGWRFTPRYQNPQEPEHHWQAFVETIVAPLAFESQIRTARLEPGQRELTAVILMPSILPRVSLTTNTYWSRLDDPAGTTIESGRVMEQGREIQAVRSRIDTARDAGCYRQADIAALVTRIDELECRLPMQVCSVDLPYRNTLGGFELFTPGSTALLPELVGYEGIEAISPSGGDAVFLLGRNFDLVATRVVIGGKPVAADNFEILSRDVLRLVVPPGIGRRLGPGRSEVEAFVATPNGVSNRLLIPCSDDVAMTPVPPTPKVPGPFHFRGNPQKAPRTDPAAALPRKAGKPASSVPSPLPSHAPPEANEKRQRTG